MYLVGNTTGIHHPKNLDPLPNIAKHSDEVF